jgi:hypothetical protein
MAKVRRTSSALTRPYGGSVTPDAVGAKPLRLDQTVIDSYNRLIEKAGAFGAEFSPDVGVDDEYESV